jgi:hypothetical protein
MRSFIFLTLALIACGGGASDSPPGPLAKHFDDMYIARVPVDQQTTSMNAQHEFALAKAENAKAEADYNDAATQLTVARNDAKTMHIGVDSAISTKNSAKKSGDNNKINQATKDEQVAEHLAQAGDARVKYFQEYQAYLKAQWRYTQEAMYWREAQYELAKSQIAKANNVSPNGVKYEWFPGQESERNKRTSSAKDRAASARKHALEVRDTWLKQQHTADTTASDGGGTQ